MKIDLLEICMGLSLVLLSTGLAYREAKEAA